MATRAASEPRGATRRQSALDRLVGLEIHRQPIVDLRSGRTFAFEALARPEEGRTAPGLILAHAWATGVGPAAELTMLSATLAMLCAEEPDGIPTFVNLSGPTLLAVRRDELLTRFAPVVASGRRIVVEITEDEGVEDVQGLARRIGDLRDAGVEVALDDAGTGFNTFERIAALRPGFIKLDRVLVAGSDTDHAKRSLLTALSGLGRQLGARVIAEGVETAHELAAVTRAGIELAQGFGFAHPGPGRPEADGALIHAIRGRAAVHRERGSGIFALDLSGPATIVPGDEPARDTLGRFHADAALRTLVVCEPDGRVSGAITRDRLAGIFSMQYGLSLHGRRPVRELADPDALLVRWDEDIVAVSELAMARTRERLYDDVVVTDGLGVASGVLPVRELLVGLSDAHARRARDLSPLTGLPGNVLIHEEIRRRDAAGTPYAVSHIDLDGFKAINDRAGFAAGDRLIVLTAEAVARAWGEHPGTVVGHVGGDDFVAFADPALVDAAADEVVRLVQCEVRPEALVQLAAAGDAGPPPAVSLSVASLVWTPGDGDDLTACLARVKARAKDVTGSVHVRATAADARTWPSARPVPGTLGL